MLTPSTAELFLAYRQAKCALFFERRAVGHLRIAEYERELPARLESLRTRLAESPGWFARTPPGNAWVVPKRIECRPRSPGSVVRVPGEQQDHPVRRVDVRLQLEPAVDFATVEVLWLWRFGAALETLLVPECRGYRLRLADERRAPDPRSRHLFDFWVPAYKAYRDRGISTAYSLLRRGDDCYLASFDLRSYYDGIDPTFLVGPAFVAELARKASASGIPFDASEYIASTETLLSQYGAFRTRCREVTGLVTKRGVPIGALTSRVVANLALAQLDRRLLSHTGVAYYSRYVDDMLVVLRAESFDGRSAESLATQLFPGRGRGLNASTRFQIDEGAIGRPGSLFELQPRKSIVHYLSGLQGEELLRAIRRDMQRLASERRVFIDGSTRDLGLFAAGFVEDPLEDPEQHTLREDDPITARRYAAGIAISRIDNAARMLGSEHSAAWSARYLAPMANAATDWARWSDYIDLTFRMLSAALVARDEGTALLIKRRTEERLDALQTPPLWWQTRRVRRPAARENLVRWFEDRVLESVCAAMPIDGEENEGGLRTILEAGVRQGSSVLRDEALSSRARLLRTADLRYLDLEDDVARGVPPTAWNDERWETLWGQLVQSVQLRDVVPLLDKFIAVCRRLGDAAYGEVNAACLVLATRPASAFDVTTRWVRADEEPAELRDLLNSVRGTGYLYAPMDRVATDVVDIGGAPNPGPTKLILGNLVLRAAWWHAASDGAPYLGPDRLTGLGRVVDLALRESTLSREPAILVLPELGLPRTWLRPLAAHLIKHATRRQRSLGLVAGLEYDRQGTNVRNEAVAVLPIGFATAGTWFWTKGRAADEEGRNLRLKDLSLVGPPPSAPRVVLHSPHGAITCLICSELLEAQARAALVGRVDLVLVPAWNPDTATFEEIVRATALDLHCYVAVANCGHYSDCRIRAPYRARWQQDVCRLIARDQDTVIATIADVPGLRAFHVNGMNADTWKPLPPGFEFRR